MYFEKDKIRLAKVIRPVIARQAQLLAYENNEIDFVEVPSADLKRIQNDPKLSQELILYDAPITWYLTPQVTHPPFDDLRVRRAVSHAIDLISVHPEIGVPREGLLPSRQFSVSGFPYRIAYRVRDHDIYVIAVAHTSRRPNYWKHRG